MADRAAFMQNGSQTLLRFGLAFEDLYRRDGLLKLDGAFLEQLGERSPGLHARLESARAAPASLAPKAESELLVDVAPYLEDFLGQLFAIEAELLALQGRHSSLAPLHAVKRKFIQRRLVGRTAAQALEIDPLAVATELEAFTFEPLTELSYATHVAKWLDSEGDHEPQLKLAADYAAWAALTPEGKAKHRDGVLFKLPQKLDLLHLVPHGSGVVDGTIQFLPSDDHGRHRDGFHLTDPGTDLAGALDQAGYCIKCHNQGKDSCSTGLREKSGAFKQSAFGVPLAGCPLEEKISEMNQVKGQGNPIGALAIVAVDNPMCAATGHRICNDCMKSCIYQKQDPVDIPQVETRTLKDVLELPWGFEIYSLLTRWNPLNFARPYPRRGDRAEGPDRRPGPRGVHPGPSPDERRPYGGGGRRPEDRAPARAALSGVDAFGVRHRFDPVRDITDVYERLDRRVMAGFGGVAEYGITVRWNKNFLKVIRLLLERRAEFTMFGGVRFGGTLDGRRRLRHGVRPHRPLHGGGPADGHPDEERPGQGRPPGVGLPDGACSSRARRSPSRWPTSRCGCRSW